MWWVPVAMAAGSMLQENERQKSLAKHNEGQAEMTRYSPWTGVRGQTQQDTGPGIFGAGVSGAAGGAAMAQSMGWNPGGGAGGGSMATQNKGTWGGNEASPFDQYRAQRFSRTA